MAATAQARRITEAHRLAQAQLGARVVQAMRFVWPLLDADDLDGSFERWLTASRSIVDGQRVVSARLAATYVSTFKALELGASPAAPLVLAETVPTAAVATSMLVTGPASVKSAVGRGVQVAQAMDTARARSAAAAMRHVLGGGRDTIAETVGADRQALGWGRAVSGRGCAFCAMLASRGPVYSEATVAFDAHDGCSCSAEPVYREDAAWPAGSERYQSMWNEATAGLSGQDAINAFRRSLSAA